MGQSATWKETFISVAVNDIICFDLYLINKCAKFMKAERWIGIVQGDT